MKKENTLNSLIDTGKSFNKIKHPFLVKTHYKQGTEGNFLNLIKSIYVSAIIFNGEN